LLLFSVQETDLPETGSVKVKISSRKTLVLAVIYGTFYASKLEFVTFLFAYFETKASSTVNDFLKNH
jgi:hypothetical protein